MKRLPIILSAAALVVSVLGATPLGQAAERVVSTIPPFAKRAGYATTAGNALALSGHKASTSGGPGTVPVFDRLGRLPGVRDVSGLIGPTRAVVRPYALPALSSATVAVDCPDDYPAVTGGGARVEGASGTDTLVVNGTGPEGNAQGWVTDITNPGTSDLDVGVYALCAKEQPQ